jgi:hypothetical protein
MVGSKKLTKIIENTQQNNLEKKAMSTPTPAPSPEV